MCTAQRFDRPSSVDRQPSATTPASTPRASRRNEVDHSAQVGRICCHNVAKCPVSKAVGVAWAQRVHQSGLHAPVPEPGRSPPAPWFRTRAQRLENIRARLEMRAPMVDGRRVGSPRTVRDIRGAESGGSDVGRVASLKFISVAGWHGVCSKLRFSRSVSSPRTHINYPCQPETSTPPIGRRSQRSVPSTAGGGRRWALAGTTWRPSRATMD